MKRAFSADEAGTTAIEYAVIASLIAVTVLAVMPVGGSLEGIFETIAAAFGD